MSDTPETLRHERDVAAEDARALRDACEQLAARLAWTERKPPVNGVARMYLDLARKK